MHLQAVAATVHGMATDLPRDIGGFIRDMRRNAKISLRQLAEQAGVSNPYLSQIERGLRKPSAEVLQQLASALRVSTPAMYLRAGLLDALDAQGVLAAIAADSDLTVAQKQSLSQIYETFRRENLRHAASEQPATTVQDGPPPGQGAVPREQPPADVVTSTTMTPTEAVVESVAVTEAGAAPPPAAASDDSTTRTTAKRAAKKAVNKSAATTAEEEK